MHYVIRTYATMAVDELARGDVGHFLASLSSLHGVMSAALLIYDDDATALQVEHTINALLDLRNERN